MPGTYTNPILNIDFADPSIIKSSDGYFYAYGTRSYAADNHRHIQVARSTDLVDWKVLGDALPTRAIWANTVDYWAPHVVEDGKYFMYFSTLPDKADGMGIGVAISDKPEGPFVDSGSPLITGPTFTTIDPCAFDDPQSGKRLLFWGSGHGPIKVQELDESRLKFKAGTKPSAVLNISNYPHERLIEGAFIIYANEFYYLFYSGDNVWEEGQYVVMVARSKSATGPYEKMAVTENLHDSVILKSNSKWDSPGQNSILQDNNGDWWMFYHAVDTSKRVNAGTNELRRVMLIDKIIWEDGWPKIVTSSPSISQQTPPNVHGN